MVKRHSHRNDDSNGIMSLFGQDVDTFTSTMLLNIDQLQKQLDKDEFQESKLTARYFVEYTRIEVKHFRDTLLQHLGNVKKSVAKRTRHQRQYERRHWKTESKVQDEAAGQGMIQMLMMQISDLFMTKSQWLRVDHYPETCQVKSPMLNSSPDNQTTEYSKQSLKSENILLKKTVAQFQKVNFFKNEAHCFALELKILKSKLLNRVKQVKVLNETSNKSKIEKENNPGFIPPFPFFSQ
ncbi:hypothetical protein Tco_0422182 [Tanacetum coccineum]